MNDLVSCLDRDEGPLYRQSHARHPVLASTTWRTDDRTHFRSAGSPAAQGRVGQLHGQPGGVLRLLHLRHRSALVFNKIFFPDISPTAGTLASFATFGVATSPARSARWSSATSVTASAVSGPGVHPHPDGPGHLRDRMPARLPLDRHGRTDCSRRSSPAARTFGGRRAIGASSLTVEHADQGKRAFYASWTLNGTQAGLLVAPSPSSPSPRSPRTPCSVGAGVSRSGSVPWSCSSHT